MRAKTSTVLLTSVVKLLGHATMGVAIGLAVAFFVTRFDPLGIMALISGDRIGTVNIVGGTLTTAASANISTAVNLGISSSGLVGTMDLGANLSLGGNLDDRGSAWFNVRHGRFSGSGRCAEAWQILSPVRQKSWGVDALNRLIHQPHASNPSRSSMGTLPRCAMSRSSSRWARRPLCWATMVRANRRFCACSQG